MKSSFETKKVGCVGFFIFLFLVFIIIFSVYGCPFYICSADAIERAWKILDLIPGRATGAYSHSQVVIAFSTFLFFSVIIYIGWAMKVVLISLSGY